MWSNVSLFNLSTIVCCGISSSNLQPYLRVGIDLDAGSVVNYCEHGFVFRDGVEPVLGYVFQIKSRSNLELAISTVAFNRLSNLVINLEHS